MTYDFVSFLFCCLWSYVYLLAKELDFFFKFWRVVEIIWFLLIVSWDINLVWNTLIFSLTSSMLQDINETSPGLLELECDVGISYFFAFIPTLIYNFSNIQLLDNVIGDGHQTNLEYWPKSLRRRIGTIKSVLEPEVFSDSSSPPMSECSVCPSVDIRNISW